MPKKDIHKKPFDEGTIVKLDLFYNYLKNWLPVFIESGNKKIQIFDFFAGPGYDLNGVKGSPIRIIDIVDVYSKKIREKKQKISVFLNELENDKMDILKKYVVSRISESNLSDILDINFSNKNFKEIFNELYERKVFDGCPNLIFIDQNGFKEVDKNVLDIICGFKMTDALFFISSSYIHRFCEQNEFKKYHPKFDSEKIKNTSRYLIHNCVAEEFKRVYLDKDCYLIPFSIMKNDKNNVYGLIFITNHIKGAEKFLEVCWKIDPNNGTANFDIYDENQPKLFEENKSKIYVFRESILRSICKNELKTNRDIYEFTIRNGFLPKHAKDILIESKREKIINFDGNFPKISYNEIYKNHNVVVFKYEKH